MHSTLYMVYMLIHLLIHYIYSIYTYTYTCILISNFVSFLSSAFCRVWPLVILFTILNSKAWVSKRIFHRPRGIGWRGRWEGGSGWGIHVNPWLIHANVWQKPLQHCKVISLQLIKINEKIKIKVKKRIFHSLLPCDEVSSELRAP